MISKLDDEKFRFQKALDYLATERQRTAHLAEEHRLRTNPQNTARDP